VLSIIRTRSGNEGRIKIKIRIKIKKAERGFWHAR
jgi:hypothetical protein